MTEAYDCGGLVNDLLYAFGQKEIQAIKGALLSATHKMAKSVQRGKLVSDVEFRDLVEAAYKGDHFLLIFDGITYSYSNYSGPVITIYSHLPAIARFRADFYMTKPYGKFGDYPRDSEQYF